MGRLEGGTYFGSTGNRGKVWHRPPCTWRREMGFCSRRTRPGLDMLWICIFEMGYVCSCCHVRERDLHWGRVSFERHFSTFPHAPEHSRSKDLPELPQRMSQVPEYRIYCMKPSWANSEALSTRYQFTQLMATFTSTKFWRQQLRSQEREIQSKLTSIRYLRCSSISIMLIRS